MKSREQMPRSAELDSPRQVIVSCCWDTSTCVHEGRQGWEPDIHSQDLPLLI